MANTIQPEAGLFDAWTRDYAELGLRMDRLAPGTVDAWTGPPEWRTAVDEEAEPTAAGLRHDAERLLERLPTMGYAPAREEYLRRQVIALQAQARTLSGEVIALVEQAELYFDIRPQRIPEETFEAAHAELDALLPGNGTLPERWAAWRSRFQAPAERVVPLLDRIAAEVRARTTRHLSLPAGESIEIRLTKDQPWSAYNWYKGGAHSLIEINTDLPVQTDNLVDYLCHEGYPGHHTEHALREVRQYREQRQGEYAIQLINTPESLIAEAIATSARGLIFEGSEDLVWAAEHVLPDLGLTIDPEQTGRVREAHLALSGVSGNAAFLLHEDGRPEDEVASYIERWALRTPEEARHSLRFLQSPLWRVYTFTYYYGYRLLKPLLSGPDRFERFRAIVTEPVYPGLLRET